MANMHSDRVILAENTVGFNVYYFMMTISHRWFRVYAAISAAFVIQSAASERFERLYLQFSLFRANISLIMP
jgi:hypothetical protein